VGAPPGSAHSQVELGRAEREMVERALKDARYNKSKAARALGLTRTQFYVRLRRHGLE
jgi:transcriptional regulator of acetoin/glycerol metabolism